MIRALHRKIFTRPWPRLGRAVRGPLLILLWLLVPLDSAVLADSHGSIGHSSDEGPAAMLIFDSSGSMWGRLGKRSKVGITRRAVKNSLRNLPSPARLGLMTYGHRRRSDCRDIEILLAPDQYDRDAMAKAVDRIRNPKGRTPIASALIKAAEALDYRQQTASIILISDGYENCRKRPCETVRALKQEAADLTVHVVALAMKAKDRARIACVAEEGGGEIIDVKSENELEAGLGRLFAGLSAGEIIKDEPVQPAGPPGLQLIAMLGPDKPVANGLRWHVAKSGDQNSVAVYEGREPRPKLDVAPGSYDVRVKIGEVDVRETVDVVAEGLTTARVALNAGLLTLSAFANRNGPELRNVLYSISRTDKAAGSKQADTIETMAMGDDAGRVYVLPAGSYAIKAHHGFSQVEHNISLAAGATRNAKINFNVGEIAISAITITDDVIDNDLVFRIFQDDPDSAAGRSEVARSAAVRPVFTLPAGAYHVVVRHGAVKADARVEVLPGQRRVAVVPIRFATLNIASQIGGNGENITELVSYNVVADKNKNSGRATSDPAPRLRLAPGRYRVTGRYGTANAETSAVVRLTAGDEEQVVLQYAAGIVSFSLLDKSKDMARLKAFWEVRTGAGELVWSTGANQPSTPLAVGSYVVVAERDGQNFTASFSVDAGERKTVELVIN